jgi:hypothetical protein
VVVDGGVEAAEEAEEAAEEAEDVQLAAGAAAEVHTTVRVVWEVGGVQSAADLRCRAEVMAVARVVAAGAKPGPRRGPAATVRAV